jgi:hypothetical protein
MRPREPGRGEANPHDHGTSWAIYGQAFGETEMSNYFAEVSVGSRRRVMRERTMRL